MTTFTPRQFSGALEKYDRLQDKLPAAEIAVIAETARKVLSARSHASPGVKADISEFRIVKPTKRNGYASARVVGRGFAILDEYGSYRQPAGYDILPTFKFNASTGKAKQGHLLGPITIGGRTAYFPEVHHPAIKAHPYVKLAEAEIEAIMGKAFDKATAGIILAAFR